MVDRERNAASFQVCVDGLVGLYVSESSLELGWIIGLTDAERFILDFCRLAAQSNSTMYRKGRIVLAVSNVRQCLAQGLWRV